MNYFYQSVGEEGINLSPGGLTVIVSQDHPRSTLYFSATEQQQQQQGGSGVDNTNNNRNEVCRVYQMTIQEPPVDELLIGDGTTTTATTTTTTTTRAGTSCYYLQRHSSVLFWLGYDHIQGTGSLSFLLLLDLDNNNDKDNIMDAQQVNSIPLNPAEQPIAMASSSRKESAVFVVSQRRVIGDNDDDDDDDDDDENGTRTGATTTTTTTGAAGAVGVEGPPLPDEVYKFFPQLPFPSSSDPTTNNPPFALHITRFNDNDDDDDDDDAALPTMNAQWQQTFVAYQEQHQQQQQQQQQEGEDADRSVSPPSLELSHVFASGIVAYDNDGDDNDNDKGNHFVVVVGSTRGHGPAFGHATGSDVDGFLVKLDMKDGQLFQPQPQQGGGGGGGEGSSRSSSTSTQRFGSAADDWILNVCYPTTIMIGSSNEGDDDGEAGDDERQPAGDPFLYIVGTTKGSLVVRGGQDNSNNPSQNWRGYVAKINVDTLQPVWTHEFTSADHDDNWVTHCRVEPDSGVVYVVGVVDGGTIIVPEGSASSSSSSSSSYGRTDIFVARVKEDGSDLDWVRQLGSSADDRPAGMEVIVGPAPDGSPTAPTATTTDNTKSILVYGMTSGSVYAENDNGRDQVVLWTLDANSGTFSKPQLEDVDEIQPTQEQDEELPPPPPPLLTTTSAPTPEPTSAPTPEPTSAPTQVPTLAPTKSSPIASSYDDDDDDDDSTTGVEDDPDEYPPDDIVDEELEEPPPDEEWTTIEDAVAGKAKSKESLVSLIAEGGSGFQSDTGPSYAGSLVYDFDRHSVYLTGSSYGHVGHQHGGERYTAHCFLTHIRMVGYQSKHLQSAEEEDEDMVQSCNAVAQQGNHLFLAGMQVHDPKKSLYSILTHLERSPDKPDWAPISNSWLQDDTTPIGYPISVAVDTSPTTVDDELSVFVLTMQSFETQSNKQYATHFNPESPNLTPGGYIKYGDNYQVAVHHYQKSNDPSNPQMVQRWQRLLETDEDGISESPFIVAGGMVQVGNQLFAVGSLKGNIKGMFLWHEDSAMENTSVDGYVIAFAANDGSSPRADDDHSRRFDSLDHRDDWIYNICASTRDTRYLYVVGATKGHFTFFGPNRLNSADAFIAKLDSQSLKTVWVQLFPTSSGDGVAPAWSGAYGCAVVPQEDILYVAGVVENGATITVGESGSSTKSHGGDDIFVSRLQASNGDIRWLRQVGSSGNENLARSTGIIADMDSNAVIYGDTTGELFRARSSFGETIDVNSPDIFVVTLEKSTGSYSQTVVDVKFELWMSILLSLIAIGGLIICGCRCFFHRRPRGRVGGGQSKYFPRRADDFQDEEEEELFELVKSSPLGQGGLNAFSTQQARNTKSRLDDFMPQYYKEKDCTSRPGILVV